MTFQQIYRKLNYVVLAPLSVLKLNAGLYLKSPYNINMQSKEFFFENLKFKCLQIIMILKNQATLMFMIIFHIPVTSITELPIFI